MRDCGRTTVALVRWVRAKTDEDRLCIFLCACRLLLPPRNEGMWSVLGCRRVQARKTKPYIIFVWHALN